MKQPPIPRDPTVALSGVIGTEREVSDSAALPRPPAPQRPAVLRLRQAALTQLSRLAAHGSRSADRPVHLQLRCRLYGSVPRDQQGGVPRGQRPAGRQHQQLRLDSPFSSSPPSSSSSSLHSSSPALPQLSSLLPLLEVIPHLSPIPSTVSHTHTLSPSSTTFIHKPAVSPIPFPVPYAATVPVPANAPEQNGILDWLRRLRLHKYYPVFKQLTMEEFLALTEDDLNKYDLTQGAKKKLKTQLELQNREMKMEKRSCSGIARVMPSIHMGPSAHPTSAAGELRVEVDAVSHHHPVSTDSSSSSGYSSSSCSPRTPLCCDSTFDRTRDIHRRVSGPDAEGGGPDNERSCLFILNSTGSSRPTAQVLPVQTDPAPPLPPSCSFGLPQPPYHPQASYPRPCSPRSRTRLAS
ncbi:Zinc finger CCHC domain-containing protein 14 BDG-29 [Collichthys lucidus]|uniref:Zinc finger CCHC domain-containing protein 14 BDG-29 n=1 Tax=Collichthys lucidus TaxID=240159 RepID=A0A4U5UEL5_COLLU|nr:Zinc finger CCHC domain-containing protein 14 BDG-29 [Collichthys lucidus]